MADAPRLFLITPPVGDAAAFAPLLEAAVDAGDVACVLIRAAARDEQGAKAVLRTLGPIAQGAGAAALGEDPRLAARAGLDGVHVDGAGGALDEALSALKPDRIVGVGGLPSRHAAMSAGEAGVDYVMFGGPGRRDAPEAIGDEVAWWAPIFTVPCVGHAARIEEVEAIAAAGAEFVALCEAVWDRPDAIAATLARASQALARRAETVP